MSWTTNILIFEPTIQKEYMVYSLVMGEMKLYVDGLLQRISDSWTSPLQVQLPYTIQVG